MSALQVAQLLIVVGAVRCGIEDLLSRKRMVEVLFFSARRSRAYVVVSFTLIALGSLYVLSFNSNASGQRAALALLAIALIVRSIIVRINDGSDRILQIGAGVIFLASVFENQTVPGKIGAWLTWGLVLLAYFDSFYAKVKAPAWRSGRALGLILNTREFGAAWLAKVLLRAPSISWVISWGVMILELSAGPAIILGGTLGLIVVGMLALMHLSIGLIMGLGRFFFGFVALLVVSMHFHGY